MATIHEAKKALEDKLSDFAARLCDGEEEVTSITCATNAAMWGLDEFEEPEITQISPTEFSFKVELALSGEQLDEKPWCGDALTLEVSETLLNNPPRGWSINDYSLSNVQLNY